MKKLTIAVTSLLFLTILLCALLNSVMFKSYLINKIQEYAKKEYMIDIQIGNLSVWFPDYIKAETVHITHTDFETVTLDYIYLHVSPFSYFTGKSLVKSCTIEGVGYGDTILESLKVHANRKHKFGIIMKDGYKLSGKYDFSENGGFSLNDLKGSFNHLTIYGKLAFDQNQILDDSRIHIKGKLEGAGHVQGGLSLQGRIDNPSISLNLASEEMLLYGLQIKDIFASFFGSVSKRGIDGQLSLTGKYDNEPFQVSCTAASDFSARPIVIKSETKFLLEETAPVFFPNLENVSGELALHAEYIIGKGAEFEAVLQNGRLTNDKTGAVLQDIAAKIKGDSKHWLITDISGTDGETGSFTGQGAIAPSDQIPVQVNLNLENMKLLALDEISIRSSGDILLSSKDNNLEVSGKVASNLFKVDVSEFTSTPSVDTVDVIFTHQEEKTEIEQAPEKNPIIFDVALKIPDARIKGSGLRSSWEGEIRLQGNSNQPELIGGLKLVDGTYDLNGKTFDLGPGTITFAGDVEKETALYIIAQTEIERNTIQIIVKGKAGNPEITLQSNPAMTQKEILSWLIFNKGLTNITKFQGTQLNLSIKNITKGNAGPGFMSKLKKSIGIDRLDIEGNPVESNGEMKVKVGKYITKNTFLSFSRRIRKNSNKTTGANSVGFETKLTKDLSLQAEVDDDRAGQLNLLWKWDY